MINNKVQSSEEIFNSYFHFITIDFNINNLKLLTLFTNLGFFHFNLSSVNVIDLKELYNF